MINSLLLAGLVSIATTFSVGPNFNATETATQTVTGTLGSLLSISVSNTGNSSNEGEGGSGDDCTSEYWATTAFGRNVIADSPCLLLTFSTSSTSYHIDVETTDDVQCGFMFIDDATDNWDGSVSNDDTLLTSSNFGDIGLCNGTDDQAGLDTAGDVTTGSSVFLFAEGLDISAGGGQGSDCSDIGVTTSAATDVTEAVTTLGTPNATGSNGFGEGLIPDDSPAKLLTCTNGPVSSAEMYVDFRVNVPSTALDGTYEMNLTFTIDNSSA